MAEIFISYYIQIEGKELFFNYFYNLYELWYLIKRIFVAKGRSIFWYFSTDMHVRL